MSVSLQLPPSDKSDKYDDFVKRNIKLKEKYAEMKASIKKFRQEYIKSIQNNFEISDLSYKQNLYRSLENLIHECEMLRDSSLMASKLELVYDWYKTKFKTLNEILDKKTHKAFFEVFPDMLLHKDEFYFAKNFPKVFEIDRRSQIEGIIPKEKLKDFKRRRIIEKDNEILKKTNHLDRKNNEFLFPKDLNVSNNLRFSSTQTSWDVSTNYNTRYASTFREPNPHREIRGSSGNYVPHYNFNNLDNQNTLFKEKNKEISEKRYCEEVHSFIDDWALKKGKFMEEIERKKDILLLLKNYEERNKANEDSLGGKKNNLLLLKEYNKEIGINVSQIRNVEKDLVKNTFLYDSNNNTDAKTTKVINVISSCKEDLSRTYNIIKEVKNKLDYVPAELNHNLQVDDKFTSVMKSIDFSSNLPELTNKKSSSVQISNPLSFYDMNNKDKLKKKYKFLPDRKMTDKVSIPSLKNTLSVDHKMANPERHNMLRQRKTLSSFDFKEVSYLKGDLAKSSVDIPLKILKGGLIAPAQPNSYEKLFLPSRGFGLLLNPFPELKKGKK